MAAGASTGDPGRSPAPDPAQSSFTSFGGKLQIGGNLSEQQAKDLASDLRTGPLPVPLTLTAG